MPCRLHGRCQGGDDHVCLEADQLCYFRQVVAALKEINPDYLMPAHCVGEPFYDMVRSEMPGKVFQSNVGTRYLFTA